MNLKGFFVTALSQALDLGIATPDDVVRHVTPEILSNHLPRPLWARLLTACLGAAKVDAQLVVETIGVPNLCEHIPVPIMWACIREIAQRSLGHEITRETLPSITPTVQPAAVSHAMPASGSGPTSTPPRPLSQLRQPLGMTPPPAEKPPEPTPRRAEAVGPSIPAPGAAGSLADVVAALESEEARPSSLPPSRARTPTGQRFRQSNTGIGRLAANSSRRPQASTSPPEPAATVSRTLRGVTDADYDVVTEVGKDDWKNALAVEDEQLVDWSAAGEETVNNDTRDDGFGRKR